MGLSEIPIRDVVLDLKSELQLECFKGNKAERLHSIIGQFEEHGNVSEKQEKVLRDIHREHFR